MQIEKRKGELLPKSVWGQAAGKEQQPAER
jgi:hypothetical protein